ncbi:MAG: type II CAAX endopeptidase family protein [Oscillospiraceae bacterium]
MNKKAALREQSIMIGFALCCFVGLSYLLNYCVGLLFAKIPGMAAPLWIYLAGIAQYILIIGIPILILSRGRELAVWYQRPTKTQTLLAVPMYLTLNVLTMIIAAAMIAFLAKFNIGIPPYAIPLPDGAFLKILYALLYVLLPAFMEELLFRGLILSRLSQFGEWFAIIVSSILFSAAHGDVSRFPSIFLLAILLAFTASRTRSLVIPTLIHFLNNALAMVANAEMSPRGEDVFFLSIWLSGVFCAIAVVLFRETILRSFAKKTCDDENRGVSALRIFATVPMAAAIVLFILMMILSVTKAV